MKNLDQRTFSLKLSLTVKPMMTLFPQAGRLTYFIRVARHGLCAALLTACVSVPGLLSAARPIVVKMATLAPEGTPWHQVIQDIARDWEQISDGQVIMKIYPGGVAGDEADVVRKMLIGQVQAGALTAEGLSYIDKGIWGLSLPLLVDDYQQLDWIRGQIELELQQRFAERGFMVMAWADVGWAYWFCRKPVRTPDDLRRLKLFNWAGATESERLFKEAGFQPVPLSAVDVMPGLQTGLIDAIETSPLTMASFQWFAVAKHMTNMRWAAMTGGLMISREAWDSIPAELQPQLLAATRKRTSRIQDEIRYSGDDAIAVMQEYGLEIVDITPEERAQWHDLVDEFGHILRGTLVDDEMYDRILELRRQIDSPGFQFPANESPRD
jgi:TRAP-type C4-dicarboxylate transport system substrate-binding protein